MVVVTLSSPRGSPGSTPRRSQLCSPFLPRNERERQWWREDHHEVVNLPATTPGELSSTWRSIEPHKSVRKKSNQSISIWWIANIENINFERRMLCVTSCFIILYVFVYSVSVVFMLLSDLAAVLTNQRPSHSCHLHSPSHSFYWS